MKPNRNPNSARLLSVRSMDEGDLEALRQPSHRPSLRGIKDAHHVLARYLASGLKLHEIAELSGYSIARISTLRSDPAVQNLVAHYRTVLDEGWAKAHDTMATFAIGNMLKAERQISEKLDEADEAGETLPMKELLALTADRMDRFGYGKKTTAVNVNVDFAKNLEAAIARTKRIAAE